MYGGANGNVRLVRPLNTERFPKGRFSNAQVFTKTYRRICDHGSLY